MDELFLGLNGRVQVELDSAVLADSGEEVLDEQFHGSVFVDYPVGQREPSQRTQQSPRLQPPRDRRPFVRPSVPRHHRVLHHFLSDRTQTVFRDVSFHFAIISL